MSNIPFGATPVSDGGARFRVWAPDVDALAVKIHGRILPANRVGEDFELFVAEAKVGDEYSLILNGSAERPDPVSRSQPHGVHGPSEIVDPYAFHWSDQEWN